MLEEEKISKLFFLFFPEFPPKFDFLSGPGSSAVPVSAGHKLFISRLLAGQWPLGVFSSFRSARIRGIEVLRVTSVCTPTPKKTRHSFAQQTTLKLGPAFHRNHSNRTPHPPHTQLRAAKTPRTKAPRLSADQRKTLAAAADWNEKLYRAVHVCVSSQ